MCASRFRLVGHRRSIKAVRNQEYRVSTRLRNEGLTNQREPCSNLARFKKAKNAMVELLKRKRKGDENARFVHLKTDSDLLLKQKIVVEKLIYCFLGCPITTLLKLTLSLQFGQLSRPSTSVGKLAITKTYLPSFSEEMKLPTPILVLPKVHI